MSGSSASVAQPSAESESGQESAQGNDAPGDNQASAVTLPVEQPTSPNEAAVTEPQAQTAQPDPYDLRDLVAQEEMADWAFWVVVVAALTFIVTSIGTFFIWRQVKLTRQAVEDTSEATDAMREANKIARDTATRQLRAYVNVTKVMVSPLEAGKKPIFVVEFVNTGNTPAKDLRLISQGFFMHPSAKGRPIRFKKLTGDGSRMVLAPNQPQLHPNELLSPLDPHPLALIISGQVEVFYAGVIAYRDVFNRRHFTTFKSRFSRDIPVGENGFIATEICRDGNIGN